MEEKDGNPSKPPEQKQAAILTDSNYFFYPETKKEKYVIAVLLPFGLDVAEQDKSAKNASVIAYNFYKGLRLAVDSLRRKNINAEVFVFDSYRKNYSAEKRLKDSLLLLKPDLIIGPLTEDGVKKIIPFAEDNKIPFVSPIATLDSAFESRYYIESNPSAEAYGKVAAALVKTKFKGQKPIMLNEYNTKNTPVAKAFFKSDVGDSLQILNWNGLPGYSLRPAYHFWEDNIIFITSKHEVFVSAILAQLKLSEAEMTIIGLYPWLYFNSQEGEVWQKYNLHLLTPYRVNYKSDSVKNVIVKYREAYNDEPDEWSLRGYDEMMLYGTLLQKHGKYFHRYLAEEKTETLHGRYEFVKQNLQTPWLNNAVHILRFEEYEFKKN